jgi:DNA-binding transcriptional LysR family regulator
VLGVLSAGRVGGVQHAKFLARQGRVVENVLCNGSDACAFAGDTGETLRVNALVHRQRDTKSGRVADDLLHAVLSDDVLKGQAYTGWYACDIDYQYVSITNAAYQGVSVKAIAKHLTLRQLRLLLAVAQSGSILKAANEVGLTQPALSKAIGELEVLVEAKLFDRTNRGVSPTPHGQILLRRAAAVVDELRQAVDELGSLTNADAGELRVGGTPTACAGILAASAKEFLAGRPGFHIQVAEFESMKLGSGVLARSMDVGIGSQHVAGENPSLLFDRLFDDRLFVVAGSGHPLASRKKVPLEEARNYRWVLPPMEGPVVATLRGAFRRHKLALPDTAITTMSLLLRFEMVASNSLLSVMYGSVLRFGKVPKFLSVLPIELDDGIPIGIIRLKGKTLAPSVEMFVQTAKKLGKTMHSMNPAQLQREMNSG